MPWGCCTPRKPPLGPWGHPVLCPVWWHCHLTERVLACRFPDQEVRRTAVQWIDSISDAELLDYLPQLVQVCGGTGMCHEVPIGVTAPL